MAKYQVAITAVPGGKALTEGCDEAQAMAAGSAVAFDLWHLKGKMTACWRVVGIPTPIGPSYSSIMAWIEIFNANISAHGTRAALPNNMGIEGNFA